MDNLEEMDKFVEKYNLPKLNQEEIENLNRPITSMEIKVVIKNLPTNKSPGPDGFTVELYEKFRGGLTAILMKFFQKIKEEDKHPNSFYESTITLISNQTKMPQKKENKRKLQNLWPIHQANIPDEHRYKNPQQKYSKQNPTTY